MNIKNNIIPAALFLYILVFLSCHAGKSGGAVVKRGLPVLRVAIQGQDSDEALARVSRAVSVITSEKTGCVVKLETMDDQQYKRIIYNPLFKKDMADIFICRDRRDLEHLAAEHSIARLDRLLDERPPLRNALAGGGDWQSINIRQYGVPFGGRPVYYPGFIMRADICGDLGIDPESIKNREDLHSILRKVQAAYPDIIPVVPDKGDLSAFMDYDDMGGSPGVFMFDQKDTALVNVFETEAFRRVCEEMYSWFDEGLILKNAAFDTMSLSEWIASGAAFGGFTKVQPHTLTDFSYITGRELYAVSLGPIRRDDSIAQEAFCISARTKYRNLCMDFLELLYTDNDLLTLCALDQPHIDYEPAVFREEIAVQSPGLDFVFDEGTVKTEIYQCGLVIDKYYYALIAGMIPPVQGIHLFLAELQAAGVETVIREKQRQFDQQRIHNQ